ncbi:hypothetical protein ACFVHS_43810 [Streptomyces sp. NPDC057746]
MDSSSYMKHGTGGYGPQQRCCSGLPGIFRQIPARCLASAAVRLRS